MSIACNTSRTKNTHNTHRQAVRASLTGCTFLSLGSIQALEVKWKSSQERGRGRQDRKVQVCVETEVIMTDGRERERLQALSGLTPACPMLE